MKTLIFAISCCAFFTLYQLQALYPALLANFQADMRMAGWMNMACLLGMVLTAPFAGRLAAKLSPRTGLAASLFLVSALTVLLGGVSGSAQVLAVRFAEGVVAPFILATCLALTAAADTEKARAQWIACYVIGGIVGGSMSRFLPGIFVAQWGWRNGFWACAGLVFAVCLVAAFSRKLQGAALPGAPKAAPAKGGFVRRAAGDPNLRLACLFGFTLLFSQSALLVTVGLHLADPGFGLDTGHIGMAYLACLPSLAVVAFSARIHALGRGKAMGIFLLAVFWLAMPLVFSWSVPWSIAGVALFSVAAYVAQTFTARWVGRVKAIPVAAAGGLYLSFYYLGGALGAAFAAQAYSSRGGTGVLLLLFGVQLLAFLLFAGLACNDKKKYFYSKQ
jgi:MFS family permease